MALPKGNGGTLFPEIAAMARISRLLTLFDSEAVVRMLTFLASKYGYRLYPEQPPVPQD